ncbi:MAG TPA: Tad domain-containing protein [Acidimicrobiales bacterium]|nr:Tad domain-containing protein [Acidimicrobiales bacterium]
MRPFRSRARGENHHSNDRGAAMVLFGMLQLALLTVAALVVDVGYVRASARRNQSIADLAVLAAGNKLSQGDYTGACGALITTLNVNASAMPPIDAGAFCAQPGNDVAKTTCSLGTGIPQARPKVTAGAYTIEVHFPVPASEIWNAHYGDGLNDGQLCQRIRLLVTTREPAFFGGVAGSKGHSVTRTATLRSKTDPRERIPALWLLDPYGCTALSASGGSQVVVGLTSPTVVAGIIKLDSDGSACSSNQKTISSTGTNTLIKAVPTSGTPKGVISLYGLPPGATSCVAPICDVADVSGGRIVPQPQGSTERATRAPVDWRYNCKTSYPNYHGLPIEACPNATPKYLDNLRTAVGTSGNPSPSTFQRWSTSHSCNPPGTVTVSGNWWVDCPGGLSIGNGTTLTFLDGNIVMDNGLSMTGGVLNVNTGNGAPSFPSTCVPPNVITPCLDKSSENGSFIYVRSGDWNVTGGTINLQRVTVYQSSGYLKVASATPNWTAPTEGPFALLSLWSELASSKFQINGGAGISLEGIFFTPEADPLSLSGGGDWGQLHAQFISYRVSVSGGGTLTMAPDANMISLPPTSNALIR